MTGFAGKRIWLIGCSTGIGRALAVDLAGQGAALILSARDNEKLLALNNELGDKHKIYAFDVTNADAMARAVNDIGAPLDSVIYLAGSYQPMPLDKLDLAVCKTIVDTNLTGALNFVHAVLPLLMAQNNPGQLVLCGSVAGYRGLPMSQPYGATKAALINLAESLRAEMGGRGLDVKIINPGFVKTPMTDKNNFKMPMMITPEEAAKAIVRGLQTKKFEISFPRRFTILMKILRLLPAPIYFRLASK